MEQMQRILKDKLLTLSTYVGAAAAAFLFGGHRDAICLRILDSVLASCVAITLLLSAAASSVGFAEASTLPTVEQKPGIFKTTFAVLFVLAIMLAGWFLLDRSPQLHWMPRTAATLGAFLLGAGIILLKWLWTRRRK